MTRGKFDSKTHDLVMMSLFTVLITVGAFIKIPVPIVPFTLQFLFTTMAGLLLGAKLGSSAVFTYVILGIIGLPIFASGGGPGYVFNPSFGYLIGFVLGTYATGKISEGEISIKKLLLANFSGLMICYVCGMLYYYVIGNYVINQPIALWPLFLYCFILAVPGDIVICIICAYLGKKLIPILRRA
ncbi:MAG: biotin transporter BioY [Phascolarctobacterium sp.]|nr:biotin transporter BioY [Phascolarctobacterium sp.]